MRKRQRYLGVVVAIGLIAGACSSGHKPVTSPTTVPPDPYAVPPVITPAYVNSVLAALEHVAGNATRALIASHSVSTQVIKDTRAIYLDPLYRQELQIASETLSGNLSDVENPPGDVVLTVKRLIFASGTCIFAEVRADFSAVVKNPGPSPASNFWGLKPKIPGDDPSGLNATPWEFFFNINYSNATQIPNQCAS